VTRTKTKPAKPVKGLESGQESDAPAARKIEGQFLERRRRRRLDLKTVHGTLRESARIYRAVAQGELSLSAADVMSRVLGRHGELLNALEQRNQLEAIQQQLAALNGEQPSLPRLASDVPGDGAGS
jgi:hypothetical protein